MQNTNLQAPEFSEDQFNFLFVPEFDPSGWEMTPSEKLIFVSLLERLRPKISLEIGSRAGGSLQVLSRLNEQVYCLDIDPTIQSRLGSRYPNVKFTLGDSKTALPEFLLNLKSQSRYPDFIHIDGDHTEQGAYLDLVNALSVAPPHRVVVLMHDTFNPIVRRGMKRVDFQNLPFVHYVDLDFAPGVLHEREVVKDQMWGGFSLFIMEPRPRNGLIAVNTYLERMNKVVTAVSAHRDE